MGVWDRTARFLARSIVLGLLCTAAYGAEPSAVKPKAPKQNTQAQAAQAFVQGFYDWYVETSKRSHDQWPMDAALKSRRWPMSEAIIAGLKADEAAAAKDPDEVVGIDFDPFLNAQDECFPYKAGQATQNGDRFEVQVFDSKTACPGDPNPQLPTVIVQVEPHKGSWIFTDFIYPGPPQQDLLGVLKALKEERDKSPKQPDQPAAGRG